MEIVSLRIDNIAYFLTCLGRKDGEAGLSKNPRLRTTRQFGHIYMWIILDPKIQKRQIHKNFVP